MKVVAGVLGAMTVAGLIVLAYVGFTGALAILLTAAALVGMIALGSTMGGRHTPDRPPLELPGAAAGAPDDAAGRQADHPGEA